MVRASPNSGCLRGRLGAVWAAVCLLLLVPSPAFAWGPATHLDFSLAVLRDLALLSPAMAALLGRFRDDFLYGSLAADITIGKNLSPYRLHCHNWQVAQPVLDLAPNDAARAFAWGYLSHLAADVVAHNYFVPYKMVEYYQRRGAAHTYWELRFDAQIPRAVWEEGRRLSTRAFTAHDRYLRRMMIGPLFSFPVNKGIFNGVVQLSRLARWRRMVEFHARRTPRVLTGEEFAEARSLSLRRVFDLLILGPEAEVLEGDPTGHRNLLIAAELRQKLRTLRRQGRLLEPDQLGPIFRPLFREAIESKLLLPALTELIDPASVDRPDRAPRGLLAGARESSRSPRLRERLRLFRRGSPKGEP